MGARPLIRQHADFRRLWIGETVSQFGTQVSMLAVPLVAVVTLGAGTLQIGLLTALETAAFLVVGLPAGAWVDRMRRRTILIVTDLLRAVLLASVPLAATLHVLTLAQLYVVVFALGICTVFFDVAYQSYLPSLVARADLAEGNARLQASVSTAYVLGPSVAGYLVQVLTAPIALLADAASFLWSAAFVTAIRMREPASAPRRRSGSLRTEIGEGMRLAAGHPVLRAIMLYNATTVLFWSVERALEVVFLVRTVGLSPAGIGVLSAVAGCGSVVAALVTGRLARRYGSARTMLSAATVGHAFVLLVPMTAAGPRLAMYAVGAGVSSFCVVVFNIVSLTLRQTLCAEHLLGRVNATIRFFSWATLPVGAVLGGVLGTVLGLRGSLWVAVTGGVVSLLWLYRSPLRRTGDPIATRAEEAPA